MIDRRPIILFLCHALLLWLIHTVNYTLAAWHVALFLPGLFMAFPALNLKSGGAILCMTLTGLWIDAASPAPFGFFTVLYLAALGIVFQFRHRLHRENKGHTLILLHLLNVSLTLVAVVFLGRSLLFTPAYWIRVLIDLVAAHLILIIIAPWFIQLQIRSLQLAGIQIYQDELESELT